jgi:hypothetical protein
MNVEQGTDERDELDVLTDLVGQNEPRSFPAGLRARGSWSHYVGSTGATTP